MTDPTTNSEHNKMLVTLTVEELRSLIREELAALNGHSANTDKENLLTPDDVANLIGVNRRWLYRHASQLPFVRRISRKNLRFSEVGLRRWVAAKKLDSRR
jgi:predicted DNA-binding transcriptional regulator AlpA